MESKQRPPVTFIARNIKITKGSSMIITKYVLIMCSGYPLMTLTSLHSLVVSCLMGKLREALWGLKASLQEIHKWK